MGVSPLLVMLLTQAVVVAASLAVPVLGPAATAAAGLPASSIGYFATAVFAGALVAAQAAAYLVARLGPVGASQTAAVVAALGLALAATGTPVGLATGAFAIGLAYAPGNPASSALLSVTTPARLRARVFSLKQTAVPVGGALAGLAMPPMAMPLGWAGACLALAGLCLATALGVEPWRRRLDATVPLPGPGPRAGPLATVLREGRLRRLAAVAGAMAGVQFATSAVLVTWLAEDVGLPLAAAGGALSAAMLASVALRIGLGVAADRFGGRAVLKAVALAMLAAALAAAALAMGGTQDGAAGGAAATVAGVALAMAAFSWNGVYLAEVAAAAPEDRVATATAGTMSFVFAGGIVGPALVATAVAAAGGYAGGFALMAVLALGALAALALDRERGAPGART